MLVRTDDEVYRIDSVWLGPPRATFPWRARYVKNNLVKKELQKLVEEGEVCQVTIKDLTTAPLYMLPGYRSKKIQLSDDAFILSPFDPLNVFRHRLRDFFNFDYQIECFVPEAKRKYSQCPGASIIRRAALFVEQQRLFTRPGLVRLRMPFTRRHRCLAR